MVFLVFQLIGSRKVINLFRWRRLHIHNIWIIFYVISKWEDSVEIEKQPQNKEDN